ncbi:MAG: 3-deoxy-D-manno-octulosonic acid transferase [Alphaproteobacteria bacterium]|nr:3-deoxy-D-manno-octulosonic acid transferase [Alphaproteobacteria bacterium]
MIALYRLVTHLGAPLINLLLWRRSLSDKEDPRRIAERKGQCLETRPPGPLIWIHAASVGEALSALPLMCKLREVRPDIHILITTGTVSSGRILAQQLPEQVIHQYVPIDRVSWVRSFLDHWLPDMAIWIESELWPNMILETAARGTPMALVNGRISTRSYRRWRSAPQTFQRLLSSFAVVLARDTQSLEYFHKLGVAQAICAGDLKHAAEPLGVDEAELNRLTSAIAARPVWLAASTHAGEEEAAGKIHETLRDQFPGLLSIVAPRHAERGAQITSRLTATGLKVARRSMGELPNSETGIYLADTMGEMGLIYRLASVVFLGGSLVPHGGQNPLEPARLGCAILHGPHTGNFSTIYADLHYAEAAIKIENDVTLANAIAMLMHDRQMTASLGEAAKAFTLKSCERVLADVAAAIGPLLPEVN